MSGGLKMVVKFEGLDAIKAAVARAAKDLTERDKVEADLLASVQPIVQAARDGAPRSAGGGHHAADTIHAVAAEPEGSEVARVAIGPSKKGWYLKFVEIGTRFMAARPFMRPALDGNLGAAVAKFRELTAKRWREAFK